MSKSSEILVSETELPGPDADLETVLGAWHAATVRLERTHEALREEVKRLTGELEVKNRKLARKNRLAELGQMASHIAHEVRNGLVPVTLYLSMLKRRLQKDPEASRVVEKIESAFTGLDVTVNDLLHFTSDRQPQIREVCLMEMVDQLCTTLNPQFDAQRVEVEVKLGKALSLGADPDMLRRAILNLLLNALDAMPDGGKLLIDAVLENGYLALSVSDSGKGLSEESLQKAAEPFYSTKSTGTGLGLAIVYRIVEVHHGHVIIQNLPTRGARITLYFPVDQHDKQ